MTRRLKGSLRRRRRVVLIVEPTHTNLVTLQWPMAEAAGST